MLDVYRTYYKMTSEPFRLSPDHRFSLAHNSYANAMSYLQYAIFQGEGFIAVTGGPGTGKTTLINDLIERLERERIEVATLTSTQLESRDLLQMVANLFDLRPEDTSKPGLLLELEQFLHKQHFKGRRVILIVDEAQGLSNSALEELRLLANLQRNNQLMLQVFLVGQEKLLEMLRTPAMEQLHQRLIAASHLQPLEFDEVVDYVEHRLTRVGWIGDPKIDEGALRLIYRYSGGIPRRINLICNRLFLYGGLEQKHELVAEDAREVIEGLHKEFLLSPDPVDENEHEEIAELDSDADAPVRSLPRGDMVAATERAPDQLSSSESSKKPAEKISPESRAQSKSAKPTPDIVRQASAPIEDNEKAPEQAAPPPKQATPAPEQAAPAPEQAAPAPEQTAGNRTRIEPTMQKEPAIDTEKRTPSPKPKQPGKNRLWGKVAVFVVLAGVVYMAFYGDEDFSLESASDDTNQEKPRIAFTAPLDPDAPVQEPAPEKVEVASTQTAITEGLSPAEPAADTDAAAKTSAPDDDLRSAKGGTDAPLLNADSEKDGKTTPSVPVLPTPPEPVARVSEKENVTISEAPDVKKLDDSIKVASAQPLKSVGTVERGPVKTGAETIEAEKARLRREAELRLAMNLNRAQPGRESAVPAAVKTAPVPQEKLTLPPDTSKPQAPVRVATAAKIKTAPKRSPRDQLKAALIEGQWNSRGKPASLLPSSVTYCNSQGERIACLSVPQDINTKIGLALYKVETTLEKFSAGSNFQLSYRTLVKLLGDDSDISREAALSSDAGWQINEYSMSCRLTWPDKVRCRDKKGITREYQRSEPALRN